MVTLGQPVTRPDARRLAGAHSSMSWSLASVRTTALLLSGVVLLAATLRLALINAWPIFMDEDGYMRGALAIQTLPLGDALMILTQLTYKPPVVPGTLALLIQAGIDPLVAGRIMMAVAGTLSTLMTFELARRLGGPGIGVVAAACYALSPLAVLNERVINMDPWMATFALAATLASLTAIERKSTSMAMLAALAGAMAVLVKTPAIAVAAVPVAALLLHRGRVDRPIIPAVIAMFGPILAYVAVMSSPLGQTLAEQNAMLMAPFVALPQNLLDLADTLWTYFPGGLLLMVVAGAALAFRSSPRLASISLLMIGVWIGPWIVLSKFAPSRYDLAAMPFLCAFAAVALVRLPQLVRQGFGQQIAVIVSVGIVAASGTASLKMVVDHQGSAMTRLDDWQYRSGWPAGYGYGEAAALIQRTAEPGSSVAYMVDKFHVVAAGLHDPLPAGVTSLGWSEPDQPLPATAGRLYVVVDDGRDTEFTDTGENNQGRVERVLAQRPDLRTFGRFSRPGSEGGVTVLQSP